MSDINIKLDLFRENEIFKKIDCGKVEKRQTLFVEQNIEVVPYFGGNAQSKYTSGTFELSGKHHIGEQLTCYAYKTTVISERCRFCKLPSDSFLKVLVGHYFVKVYDADKLISADAQYSINTVEGLRGVIDPEIAKNINLYNKNMSKEEVTNVTRSIIEKKLKELGLEIDSLVVLNHMFK